MKIDFFNKKTGKKGFTLAELMIVLAVLAVIAAVLMPTVFNSMPDENRLKFKKGYYTLKRTIDAMVNSEAYHQTGGNFGAVEALNSTTEGGVTTTDPAPYAGDAGLGSSDPDGSRYFCAQFSEMLNSTYAQCGSFIITSGVVATNFEVTTFEDGSIDNKCENFMPAGCNADGDPEGCGINLKTQDGIYWSLPQETFSGKAGDPQRANVSGYNKIPGYYAVICMDVDGPGGEAPFGFGIRRDGKVVAGEHAKEWLQEGTTNTVPDAN